MCKYIEYSLNNEGGMDFVREEDLIFDDVAVILGAVEHFIKDEDIDPVDINFIERINMKEKVKLIFKYGFKYRQDEQAQQEVTEINIDRVCPEYYQLRRVI